MQKGQNARMLHKNVEMNMGGNSEKLKTTYYVEGTIGDHTSQDISLSAILDAAITRNHKNGNYNLWSQRRDLQPKPYPTKFGSIFNFNMMSAI